MARKTATQKGQPAAKKPETEKAPRKPKATDEDRKKLVESTLTEARSEGEFKTLVNMEPVFKSKDFANRGDYFLYRRFKALAQAEEFNSKFEEFKAGGAGGEKRKIRKLKKLKETLLALTAELEAAGVDLDELDDGE